MFKSTLILGSLLIAGSVQAADPLTDAMQKAYVPYRVVLSKTNNKLQEESTKAVAEAQQSWWKVVEQFADNPPAPYDRDPAVKSTMTKVSEVYRTAADEIRKQQLTEAHETLEQVRRLMAEMRHRNNVIVYSDYAMAYLAQRDWILNEGPKILDEENGLLTLSAQLGVLEHISSKLKSEAPADYLANNDFLTMYGAVEKSVANLKSALFTRDTTRIKAAIADIKLPYGKLFITFG